MTQTRLITFNAAISLIVGIALMTLGAVGTFEASLTGVGVTILDQPAAQLAIQEGPMHSAAFVERYASAEAARSLVLGILLVVTGFLLHAIVVSKGERRVPVRAGKRRPAKGQPQWFWVEMKV